MREKQSKEILSGWSKGGQIFYNGGLAWGVSSDLQSICIGGTQEVQRLLQENKTSGNPVIDNILIMEKNCW